MELLRRTTRSVVPTQAGELVAARARAVLAETDALRGDIDELRGLTRGHVNVGAMLFGGELDIPTVIARFTSSYPDVEVGLREGTAQRMLEMLSDGSLDVAFALEVRPPDGVQRLELSERGAGGGDEHRPPAGRATSRCRSGRSAGTRLIAFQRGSSTRQVVDAALTRTVVRPEIALEANDLALLRSLVARGIGVAILPPLVPRAPRSADCVSPAAAAAADDRRAVVAAGTPAVARRAGVRRVRRGAAAALGAASASGSSITGSRRAGVDRPQHDCRHHRGDDVIAAPTWNASAKPLVSASARADADA